MAKTPLPAGWTDELTGYATQLDPSLDGYWLHEAGAVVTRWKDDLSVTWSYRKQGGTVRTLHEAFILAEAETIRHRQAHRAGLAGVCGSEVQV